MKHSKFSIFLMEIILNIFLFTLFIIVCLQIFMKANTLSKSAVTLQRSVNCCTSIAEVFQSSSDYKSALLMTYPNATDLDTKIQIYFDEQFEECHQLDSYYRAVVTFSKDVVETADICLYQGDDTTLLYSLSVSSYQPLQSMALTGGDSVE